MVLPPEQRSDRNIGRGYDQFTELDIRETKALVVDNIKGILFVNQYLVVKDIGRGSHGGVKLCLNTEDDTLYAMKVVNKEYARRRNKMALYQQSRVRIAGVTTDSRVQGTSMMLELAVMRRLDHPNVVRLYEVVDDPDVEKLVMIMEYVDGGSILPATMSTNRTPLSEEVALTYFVDIVRGLEYLHRHGVVHGDLKPSNLLLSANGKVKITDFGSAHFTDSDDMIGRTGGSPAFMAPEICTGKPYRGFPADIWALGVTLYMLVYGTVPFQADTIGQLYDLIRDSVVTFPIWADVSPALLDLLKKLLHKDPRKRLIIDEIKMHPWVTRNGTVHLPRNTSDRFMKKLRTSTPESATRSNMSYRYTFVSEGEEVVFEEGQYLIRQGQLVRGIYLIQEGTCELYHLPANVRRANSLVIDHDFAALVSDSDEEDYGEEPTVPNYESGGWSSMGGSPSSSGRYERVRRSAEARRAAYQGMRSADGLRSGDARRSAEGGKRSADGRRSAEARRAARSSSGARRYSQHGSMNSMENLMGLLPTDMTFSPTHTLPALPGTYNSLSVDIPHLRPGTGQSSPRSPSPYERRYVHNNSSRSSYRRSRNGSLHRSMSYGGGSAARSPAAGMGRMLRRAVTYSNLNNQAALWRKAVNRSASMHERVMKLVLDSAKTSKLRQVKGDTPSVQLVAKRGPTSFVGGVNMDGMPKISETSVVAKTRVRAVLIKAEQVRVLWNHPLVRAAIAKADTDATVMDTLERLGEFAGDVKRIDQLRKSIMKRSANSRGEGDDESQSQATTGTSSQASPHRYSDPPSLGRGGIRTLPSMHGYNTP